MPCGDMCVVSCVVSKGVSPFRVVSCRVLSRPVVYMWWSPNGVCASFFSKGPWQSHCPSCDEKAHVNNAPRARSTQADVRVYYHHETAVQAVRVLILTIEKSLFTWESPTASVEKNSRDVESSGPSKECQDPHKETDLLVLVTRRDRG